MADDDLLSRLGAVARELENEREPGLDRLVTGTATDDERRELARRAADDPALRDDMKRLEPVGEAVRQHIVERARFELSASSKRSRARWLVPASLAAAAAAALLLARGPAHAPLPDYALTVAGGIDEVRGDDARERLVVGPDTPVDLLLRPARDVTGPVALRAFFRDDPARMLALSPDISAQGSLRVHGRAHELLGTNRGERELVLIACRPDVCEAAARVATNTVKGEGWRAAYVQLSFEP